MLKFSLRKSDHVVALDRFMAARLEAKGAPASKVSVVPLWPHAVISHDPRGAAEFRRRHGLDGKFVVMYSGNHSPCHPLATLLEAAARLRDHAEIAFCFVGGGSEMQTVRQFSEQERLRNILVLPYQPWEGLSASLSAADLHAVVMGDPFTGIVHPSKIYNIRQVGAPVLYIGPASGPIADLAPEYSFRHGDGEGVAGLIGFCAARTGSRVRSAPLVSRGECLSRLTSIVSNTDAMIPNRS